MNATEAPAKIYTVTQEHAEKIADWLKTRNGVRVWVNRDLGSPRVGLETFTPATDENGNPYPSPHWSNGNEPTETVTDAARFVVQDWREVKRMRIRRGPPCYGFVHRADRAKLDRAMTEAGDGATYVFDYSRTNYGSPWFDAVVSVPTGSHPLSV